MKKEFEIHDHPSLEKIHNIPEDHVIIDRKVYNLYRRMWELSNTGFLESMGYAVSLFAPNSETIYNSESLSNDID